MPAYDFRCSECQTVFEVVRPIRSTEDETCPECGGETKRVFSPVGVVFKGSGFHTTDYRQVPGESSGDAAQDDAPKGDSSKKEDSTAPCSSADAKSGACTDCPSAPGND